VIEVVAFARALADAGEHRQAGMLRGDVVDQLQHVHRLADAGAAEQADLAALGERTDQVDDLDAGFEQVVGRGLFVIARRGAMDFPTLLLADRTGFVDRIAEHVHDAAERLRADRHLDAGAGVVRHEIATQAVGRAERDRAHDTIAELLLHLERDRRRGAFDVQCVVHLRHLVAREFDVDDGADDLDYFALVH
jgi:peptide chain release factor 1